jgi:diadenosine tetraphosphate (Ap4A) HIT family hydrolase
MFGRKEFKLDERLENDSTWVFDFPLSELRLINDAQFTWFILVPRVKQVKEIIDLNEEQQIALLRESSTLSRVLKDLFKPDKLNVAAIGNVVSQLHVHHICRFKKDVAWPAPVWGRQPMVAYSLDEQNALIGTVQKALTRSAELSG